MTPLNRGASTPCVRVGAEIIHPARHPEHAYIDPRTGYRNLTTESRVREREDGAIIIVECEEPVAVVVELPASGVEWLLDELDDGDGFTRLLAYARDLARVKAWDRAVAQ